MSIPTTCKVLIVGGGPAGSYAASCLAREGVDTVLLEADVFPRYHVGESMLPSMRHFLRFIDLDAKFDAHGFKHKNGAAFKLNALPPAYTNFIAAGGPQGYAWNVVRSEADDLMFRHAGESGAKIFDGVKVQELQFVSSDEKDRSTDPTLPDIGRPVGATWKRKDGTTGSITFEYIVDASGRAGIVSTKHMKNRKYNQGLKNVASWGYWTGANDYAVGTMKQGQPYFEALADASGWVWTIPLHNGTVSVGVVMNQEKSIARKKAMGSPSSKEFYLDCIRKTAGISELLPEGQAKLVSEIKAASDFSYSASTYASPYTRIAGDAGCFIDPFFSSGVHLAMASGLSAATTICASIRGDCDERTAAKWHSHKVADGYTRFLLVVLSALKQIKDGDEPVLTDFNEEGFDRAFAHFRPIIQGTADVKGELTQGEIAKTVDFCFKAFIPTSAEERDHVLQKMAALGISDATELEGKEKEGMEAALTADELRILNSIRARQMIRSEDTINIDNFSFDTIDGLKPNMLRGSLGLVPAEATAFKLPESSADDPLAKLMSEAAEMAGKHSNTVVTQVEIAAH